MFKFQVDRNNSIASKVHDFPTLVVLFTPRDSLFISDMISFVQVGPPCPPHSPSNSCWLLLYPLSLKMPTTSIELGEILDAFLFFPQMFVWPWS